MTTTAQSNNLSFILRKQKPEAAETSARASAADTAFQCARELLATLADDYPDEIAPGTTLGERRNRRIGFFNAAEPLFVFANRNCR